MYKQTKSTARSVVAAGVVIAMVVVFWMFYRSSGNSSSPQPTLLNLKTELSSIPAPAGATLVAPTEESMKVGSLLVTNRFAVQQSGAEARAQFRAELTSHGWQYKSSVDRQLWIDTYCKSSLAAHVELLSETSASSNITLSLSWNELTLRECSPQG
jgi:hypothetical protein